MATDWKERDRLSKERNGRYRQVIVDLAEHFPDWGIELEQDGFFHPTMATATGAKMYFRLDAKGDTGGMIRVSGHYPSFNGSTVGRPDERPRVGVNMDRGAEALAKAIKSRFLDHYLRLFNDSLEYVEMWEERDRKKMATFDGLVERFNAQPLVHTLGDGRSPMMTLRNGKASTTVTVSNRDINIEMNWLTTEQATRVLAALTI